MSINLFNDESLKLSDNVTKQNLSTYINKYISDTIYIIQLQISSFSNNINNINNNNILKSYEKEKKNIEDEVNLIKKINKSLNKELFYLNNSRIDDISKIIHALSQRNELLNYLMDHYFTKQNLIEKNEILINKKLKIINKNKDKTLDKKYINLNLKPKINFYIENLKKNNEYNYKKHLNVSHNVDSLNYIIHNEDSLFYQKCTRNRNKNFNKNLTSETINSTIIKNKNKNNLNKSYDSLNNDDLDNLNNLSNINNKNNNAILIDLYRENNKYMNNNRGISRNSVIKKRKIHSVVKTLSNDSIYINKFDMSNTRPKFDFKNIIKFNKINLDKLNDISSNILLVQQQNKND